MQWLLPSIALSVILTIVLNVLVRAFPGGAHRAARRVDEWVAAPDDGPRTHVRVFFPWRSMLLASVVLTILVNLFARR
ncbi:MAG TPA: DUF2905 family protein [Acidimicrobiales bacterium]|nr:DUF2905 family protein [Acidimicrobiales bacterium]